MATRVRTRRWTDMRRESAMLIADIKNNEPTVLLVDNFSDNWSKWLADNPDVAGVLRKYRLVEPSTTSRFEAKRTERHSSGCRAMPPCRANPTKANPTKDGRDAPCQPA